MRRSTYYITSTEALRRVFLPPRNDATIRTYTTRPTNRTPKPSQCLSFPHPSPIYLQRLRHASTKTALFRPFAPSSPSPDQFGPKDNKSDRRPRDEEISALRVYMVRPSDSRLTEPQLLSNVLAMRERDDKGKYTQFVQEVSPPSEELPYPVCKMSDKKAAREAEEAKLKAAKAVKKTSRQSKQLLLSWTVSDNDLGHRMARLKEFLEKGSKVELVFGSQRKSGWAKKRAPTEEEANGVLEKIRKAVGEVEGAQEKEMQGTIGKEAVLSFECKAKK